MMLKSVLRYVIREGALRLVDAKGRAHDFGRGEPKCAIQVHDAWTERKIGLQPRLGFFEAYMDGRLDIPLGTLRDVIDVFARNYVHLERLPSTRLLHWISLKGRWLANHNPIGRAQENVAHHYDLSGRLYDLFLDDDKQYSCGYFIKHGDSLELSQEQKKRHLAAKLYLHRPGLRVLDIGSGWGGLGLYLAQVADCDVTGVTLSTEQHAVSEERCREARLEDRCRFRLKDYRLETGPYDRIVSVGMFEHVGKRNYQEFFTRVRDLLSDDGVCLLHSIGRFDEPAPTHPFIRKYIFPGGDLPALSELLPIVERLGLLVTDIEILRLHYAQTLRHWHERFERNRKAVLDLYDERFYRMWESYLLGSEVSFLHLGLMVFQLQLTKRQDALPLTRDYITDWERAQGMPRPKFRDQKIRAAQ